MKMKPEKTSVRTVFPLLQMEVSNLRMRLGYYQSTFANFDQVCINDYGDTVLNVYDDLVGNTLGSKDCYKNTIK